MKKILILILILICSSFLYSEEFRYEYGDISVNIPEGWFISTEEAILSVQSPVEDEAFVVIDLFYDVKDIETGLKNLTEILNIIFFDWHKFKKDIISKKVNDLELIEVHGTGAIENIEYDFIVRIVDNKDKILFCLYSYTTIKEQKYKETLFKVADSVKTLK